MSSFYYEAPVARFLETSEDAVLGALTQANPADLQETQRNAWREEIRVLRSALAPLKRGHVLFEFAIPRLGKRIDVVVLLGGSVFVLEFKIGARQWQRQARAQVWDYALDLKHFHAPSQTLTLVPVLIATRAPREDVPFRESAHGDGVYEPLCCNGDALAEIFARFPFATDVPDVVPSV